MPHRRRLAASLAALLGLVTLSPLPHAHAEEPSAEATAQARAHFKQGRAYQEAGAYEQAIAEYEQANRLAPRPELLFNIAQCHRLAGQAEPAIDYYRRFVEAAPDAAVADEARAYIATLERQRAQAEAERAERARAARPSPPPPAPVAAEPVAPVAPVAVAVPSPAPTMRWLGVGGVVTGALLVGAGAYFGQRAASTSDDLGRATRWTVELDAREDAAQTDQQRMYLLVGGGSVLVVGGALLWWWSGRTGVKATPVLARDHAGLMLHGRF